MTWFLIILNVAGGEPTFIEMPNEQACQTAVAISEEVRVNATVGSRNAAKTWCIPAGEWPEYDE